MSSTQLLFRLSFLLSPSNTCVQGGKRRVSSMTLNDSSIMTQMTFIWFMSGMLPFILLVNSSKFMLFNVFVIFDFTELCSCLSWDWSWLTHKMISKLFLTVRTVAYLFDIDIKSVLGICNTKPSQGIGIGLFL